MSNNFFRAGSYYQICDVCGHKYHMEEMRKRWDGMIVCKDDFESRHPMDFLRVREDKQSVSNARPRPSDSFIVVTYYFQYVENQNDYIATDYVEDSDS